MYKLTPNLERRAFRDTPVYGKEFSNKNINYYITGYYNQIARQNVF